jgi:hypothetical protein
MWKKRIEDKLITYGMECPSCTEIVKMEQIEDERAGVTKDTLTWPKCERAATQLEFTSPEDYEALGELREGYEEAHRATSMEFEKGTSR